jgi:hypothetical protein
VLRQAARPDASESAGKPRIAGQNGEAFPRTLDKALVAKLTPIVPATHSLVQSSQIVSSDAVVSRCDASPVLQLAEHAFDDVSALIGGAIKWVWGPPSGRGETAPIFLCVSHRRRLLAS